MYTICYLIKKTYQRYDSSHIICYLGEKAVTFKQTSDGEDMHGFSYTGPMPDGGTLIECDPDNISRDSFINAIISSKYKDTENAIKTHQIELLKDSTIDKAAEYEAEWQEFNEFRAAAIAAVDNWLSTK
jgi:hypothetical protein